MTGLINYFFTIAGWSSQVARRAHNPKVEGSNPSPATRKEQVRRGLGFEAPSFISEFLPVVLPDRLTGAGSSR